jgi:hypothetical protein
MDHIRLMAGIKRNKAVLLSILYSYLCSQLLQSLRSHSGLETGIKRTPIFLFAIAVKTLSDSISPCYLQLKHIK